MNNKILKKIIVISFILVPILSSIISTFHLIDLFQLGNPSYLSIALAVTIEIGSIASFLTLSILSRLNRAIVWTVFIILFFMQVVGNTYFSYEWLTEKMVHDPTWINSFKEMIEFFFGSMKSIDVKMYLSMLISWPIPLISVFLLKSAADYLGNDETPEVKEESGREISFSNLKDDERENFKKSFSDDSTVES